MTISSLTFLYWFLVALMGVGIVGAFVPVLPGTSLIVGAVLVWTLVSPAASSLPLIVALIAFILSLGVGYLATYIGTKKVGASSWGQTGSIVGLAVGFLGLLPALPVGGPLLGIIVGSMLGAFLGEFLFRKELDTKERIKLSCKVSLAVVVSSVVGTLLEGLLAFTAVIVFLWKTWPTIAAT
ncbi:DUF456 domain-containing protein [Synechococcus sp. PCC 7335]|uniref:DUF456 domain-containing protein n=1 Tax=Synechococcus sp. (strain ATCC 29403 / PCC 7335) TaxID=91464 RepID=UPI00056DC79B|nr:DUF456 family protein [Synechococcus sp. PCC 7335]